MHVHVQLKGQRRALPPLFLSDFPPHLEATLGLGLLRCECARARLTPQAGQNADVGLVQERQGVVADVQVRKVRDEVVPHQEAHQNPVIDYPLQVVSGAQVVLKKRTQTPAVSLEVPA